MYTYVCTHTHKRSQCLPFTGSDSSLVFKRINISTVSLGLLNTRCEGRLSWGWRPTKKIKFLHDEHPLNIWSICSLTILHGCKWSDSRPGRLISREKLKKKFALRLHHSAWKSGDEMGETCDMHGGSGKSIRNFAKKFSGQGTTWSTWA